MFSFSATATRLLSPREFPAAKRTDLSSMTMHRVGRDRLSAIDFISGWNPRPFNRMFHLRVHRYTHPYHQTNKKESARAFNEILSTLVQNYTHAIQQNHDVIGGCKVILHVCHSAYRKTSG